MSQNPDFVSINVMEAKITQLFTSSLIYVKKMRSNIFCFILESIILSLCHGSLLVLFATPQSITNLIKKNLKSDSILGAVIRELFFGFKKRKVAYLCVSLYISPRITQQINAIFYRLLYPWAMILI